MAHTLFILGAGASHDAGGPLMTNFLDTAEQLWKSGRTGKDESDFKLVFKGLDILQRVQAKAYLEANNIEEAFASFEMMRLLGGVRELPEEEMDRLPIAMRRVIARTLENSIRFPISGGCADPPASYQAFGVLIRDMVLSQRHSAAVVSFNYDIALDYAFHDLRIPANLRINPDYDGNDVSILKLHGSLLWAHCESCNVISNCLQAFQQLGAIRNQSGFAFLNVSDAMQRMCCSKCGKGTSDPLIVPPTWNKSQYHTLLSPVWHAAKREMEKAENIIVIGYSLPNSDHFFRHLYALGTMGPSRIKNFLVFDPDSNPEFKRRYEQLLGPLARNRFHHYPYPFAEAVSMIRNLLEIKSVAVGA